MAGLVPHNLRLVPPGTPPAANDDGGVSVDVGGPEAAQDPSQPLLRIEHEDGSITISMDGRTLGEPATKNPAGWFDNLVDEIDDLERTRLTEDLIRGIDDDLQSRATWIDARATILRLLGLKIDVPGIKGAADGAPVDGMSTVRHPLLLEAVLRFAANARSELLPSDGPVKVRNDGSGDAGEDQLATALQKDMNHWLTAVATEYYPDTDKMLLVTGAGGAGFKKVFRCPLRNRPVSESVDAEDLIVSNNATDLANAGRVTHRSMMRPSVVKRLQLLGVYRDVPLSTPLPQNLDAAQRERKEQQGVAIDASNPEDRDREIYECYCELNVKGFEHQYKGKESGLEIPYRVTIDVSSRQMLAINRNYNEQTKELPVARKTFVKYPYVPGLGFYDIGLGHILGDTANALTAAERLMLDNGMFANFPGFLVAKAATKQNTNIVRVPPGSGAPIDTMGADIRTAVMPLPYSTQGMAALMTLAEHMEENGQRLGGTAEISVGEGRQDAPVGTTLALIDQATKIENSVHKRLHAAQAEEIQMLVECFREDPESFWRCGDMPSGKAWDEATFLAALKDCNLVPQADPNTSSQTQRLMKAQGLLLLSAASPSIYDPIAVHKLAIRTLGFNNPEQYMAPISAMGQPPPQLVEMQTKLQIAKQEADAKTTVANAKAAEMQAKAAQGGFSRLPQQASPYEGVEARAKLMDAETKRADLHIKREDMMTQAHESALDRQSRERLELLDLAREVLSNPQAAAMGSRELPGIEKEVGA
jgi:hypothetical protein